MSTVIVSELLQPPRTLLITQKTEEESISTTRIYVSDLRANTISLVNIDTGTQGPIGPPGPSGASGRDGLIFDVLPIASGGTNNTNFSNGHVIAYDGTKLASTQYTISDILAAASGSSNAITGIIPGTGLQKTTGTNNTVLLDVNIGEGLTIDNQKIIVDSTIARTAELELGAIPGVVPISKGGTNNSSYSVNKLIYYNGTKFATFPLATGNIVVSGSTVEIIAGSGLTGGGNLQLPNGSVVLNIAGSNDFIVSSNLISLSNTGIAGEYTKITTDDKGRVVSGSNLTNADIITLLGYTPWHPGNDGAGSTLDADLLDGQHGDFYRDGANITGTIDGSILPDIHGESQYGTKLYINTKGIVEGVFQANSDDIISSLGYVPLDATNDAIKQGSLTITSDLSTTNGDISFYDNMPLFGTNRENILPSEPRGFTFNYGGICCDKTGLFAYYPTENKLKLITNIHSSGFGLDGSCSATDPESCFDDDANGGNASTIYVTQNLQGEAVTVLFREIADQLYINTDNEQTIYGLKRFLGEIEVAKQIRILSDGNPFTSPPIDVGGNNIKVEDLNADLLDDRDGSYYLNAANITGSFSYDNVTFDHIQGQDSYIPKFTDSADPARKITSSNILQRDDGSIEISWGRNLIVGESDNNVSSASINTITAGENNTTDSENSLNIGSNNIVEGLRSAAIGSNNITSGNNSLALNLGSVTRTNNSIAAGQYGLSYLENQFAFGAFRTMDGSEILEHGQYSTVAAYLRGTATNGSWVSMTPVIQLPQDKTVAYNVQLLINRGLSSGVASFTFASGIVNNATYRNPFNITEILNTTTVPNSGTKTEQFNSSQLRRHYHFWNYQPYINNPDMITSVNQYVHCNSELYTNPIKARNIQPYYFYQPVQAKVTGIFKKSFDGSLELDINKPRFFGSFTQSIGSPNIKININDHRTTNNALVDIVFESGSHHLLPYGRYKVLSSNNNEYFYLQSHQWIGTKITESGLDKIKINSSDYDDQMSFHLSGFISSDNLSFASTINSYGYDLYNVLKPDMAVQIIYNNTVYNRIVTIINPNSITLNHPIYTTGQFPNQIFDNIQFRFKEYSYYLFKTCSAIYVNNNQVNISGGLINNASFFPELEYTIIADSGAGTVANPVVASVSGGQNSGIFIENDLYNNLSFSIIPSIKLDNIADGSTVSVQPIFSNNSGYINCYLKDSFDCKYTSVASDINRHTGYYIRFRDNSPYHQNNLIIFDSNNQPINFISNPPHYSFEGGYDSEYNQFFDIVKENNRYYLHSKAPFDYEDNPVIPVKLNVHPYTDIVDRFTKTVYIYLQDQEEKPYLQYPIPDTGVGVDSLFYYVLPENMFIDSDGDELTITTETKGGHSLPRWLTFDSSTLAFSGVPDICDIGAYAIDVIATDPLGLSYRDTFIIEVSENTVQSLEGYGYDINTQLSMSNIYLTSNTLLENAPSGTRIGEIKTVGGYNPYVIFRGANNTFSGVFTENSDMVRHCLPNIISFGSFAVSGTPKYLDWNTLVTSAPNTTGLPSNTRVHKVFQPTTLSGTPLYTNKIITDDANLLNDHIFFNRQYLPDLDRADIFGAQTRVRSVNDYSITLSNYLLQELGAESLILTEDNKTITHEDSSIINNFLILTEAPVLDNLISEDKTIRLKYDDKFLPNTLWSIKQQYSFLFDETLTDSISNEEDEFILTDNYSNIEYLFMPSGGRSLSSDSWYQDKPLRIERQFHSGLPTYATGTYPSNPLSVLNFDSDDIDLLISNIDYIRPVNDLYFANDRWRFLEPINNAVLYVNSIGSEDNAHFLTEQRAYSGSIYGSSPLEYGLLETEDGYGLISDTPKHHGSRLELSTRYELLESKNVFYDNGQIFTEASFEIDSIICENNDRIVHDYAISAQSGHAYILFPGTISEVVLSYPSIRSYSAARTNDGSHGFYEDVMENTPSLLAFSEPDYYYSWAKLIPYRFYTDEYAVQLTKNYLGSNISGDLIYTGDIPQSGHYFPEKFNYAEIYPSSSGDCAISFNSGGFYGFDTLESFNPSGHYVTGSVFFYTDLTSNTITLLPQNIDKDINLDTRYDNYIYLYDPITNHSNPLLPRIGTYHEISSVDPSMDSITVENYFLYPSPADVTHTGSITLNIDRNHGKKIKHNTIINRIPIIFNSVLDSNQNRVPKNNLFDILAISGNVIHTTDNTNYLLHSADYPTYLDDTIEASYLTNGCLFLGSMFHDDTRVYDVRPNLSLFSQEYLLTYEFDKSNKKLIINLPTGIAKPFDRIKLYDFKPLSPYMPWDDTKVYNTGFMIYRENLSTRNIDDVPDKDFVLLERSSAVLQPEYAERLVFDSDIFANGVSGTCIMVNRTIDRLQIGNLINHENNSHNMSGHQIMEFVDGYAFSGFIPRFHNIVSSTGIQDDSRIGYSSVVSTGSSLLLSGIRSHRFASSGDVGHTELYQIRATGFIANDHINIHTTNISGVGAEYDPYQVNIVASGYSKELEFLYLGHNSNMLNISGSFRTSGNHTFSITTIDRSSLSHYYFLKDLGVSSGFQPIYSGYTQGNIVSFVTGIPLNRFDIIRFNMDGNGLLNVNNTNGVLNSGSFAVYAEDIAVPSPLLLHSGSVAPHTGSLEYYPRYTDNTTNTFHILPVIDTTVKYCNTGNIYAKNNDMFYNGNLLVTDHFSSLKSYLNYNDTILIKKLNNKPISSGCAEYVQKINASTESSIISGITISGPKIIPSSNYIYPEIKFRELENRHVLSLGNSPTVRLPITGSIEFVGFNSGIFSALLYNNISMQQHGGYTSHWPQDYSGRLVEPCITGIYFTNVYNEACSSGRMCLTISGYKGQNLANILDYNYPYYFDLSDTEPGLNNIYYIKDKLSNTTVSISTPYRDSAIGKSGIVYIIDSAYNIKGKLNPNYNNSFIIENMVFGGSPTILENKIDYFDSHTKKWNYLFHLKDNVDVGSYPLTFNGQTATLIKNSSLPITITDVKLYDDQSLSFASINQHIDVYEDTTSLVLQITTADGTPQLEADEAINTPKVYIDGVGSFRTIRDDPRFGYVTTSGWKVGVEIIPLPLTGTQTGTITVRDETGQSHYPFSLTVNSRQTVIPTYPTGYTTVAHNSWSMYFDVKGIDLLTNNALNQGLYLVGSPNDLSYNFVRHSSSELEVVGYPAGSSFSTGIWTPIVKIAEQFSGKIVASGSGILSILDSLEDRPAYIPYVNNLPENYYIDLTKLENISMQVPVYFVDANHNSINTTLNGGSYFNTTRISATHDADMNRFVLEFRPINTGDSNYLTSTAYAPSRPFSFSVSQPTYSSNVETWNTYNSDIYNVNYTFYRPLTLNTTYINDTASFALNRPWSIEFIVDEGITKHRSDLSPRVTLYNTPNPGGSSYRYLSYSLTYSYDSINKYWVAKAIGKPDQYGNYAPGTGLYTIDIFADDTLKSVATGQITIQYTDYNYIDYILPNIYATPNNEFFTSADIFETYNIVGPRVTFDGENTLIFNQNYQKYNEDYSMWEYAATGNKLIDKWDARINVNASSSPSITIQCKGIATDKITAIAKVDILELQNNSKDVTFALPIKITGITGGNAGEDWTPESGLLVNQGTKPWTLNFKTIYGLESPLHPPTIILEDMPTFCTGYDPRLDPLYSPDDPPDNLQNACLQGGSPNWNNQDKAWEFSFSGLPSCTLIGPLDFSITAIDTDLSLENPYIEPADVLDTLFTYLPIDIQYGDPIISAIGENEEPLTNTEIIPVCGDPYYQKYRFGPAAAPTCGFPTGLTGIFFSGSLPTGLSYTWTYPDAVEGNRFNAPLYNNLGSGVVTIEGTPEGYPPEGQDVYNEIFYITVVDARNNSKTQAVNFAAIIETNKPNIGFKVFFDSQYPVFTPKTGLSIIQGSSQSVWRPEAEPYELQCHSLIPNNTSCKAIDIYFSGLPDPDRYLTLWKEDGTALTLNAGTMVYLELASNNSNNGRYMVHTTTATVPNPNLPVGIPYIITTTDFSPRTGIGRMVAGVVSTVNLKDFSKFFYGDISQNYVCMLGNGLIDIDRSPNSVDSSLGIRGFVGPSFSGSIPVNSYYSSSDIFATGLEYTALSTTTEEYSQVSFISCLETGYLRFSGVLLPKIYMEITDPPPAQNRLFSDNSSTFALNSRLSFGDTSVERSIANNWRAGTANYAVKNLYSNNTILSNQISINPTNQQSIFLSASLLSSGSAGVGTVYEMYIQSSGGAFPTYSSQALPTSDKSYYLWLHKAANTYDIPSQQTMPPIIPVSPRAMQVVSGVLINYNNNSSAYGIDSQAVGGYVPQNICPNNICPNGYTNEPFLVNSSQQQWFAQSYLPSISGIISSAGRESVEYDALGTYQQHQSQTISFNVGSNITGYDLVKIALYKILIGQPPVFIENLYVNLNSDNYAVNDYLIIDYVPSTFMTDFSGHFTLLNQITDIDTVNNNITIRHCNMNLNFADIVILDSSGIKSTAMNQMSNPGALTISNIDNTGMVVHASNANLYEGFAVGDYIDNIYKYIEDNIKVMPNHISSDIDGIYDFIISGRANILYGKYTYKIVTKENSSMPIYNSSYGLGLTPKAFFKNVPLYVAKPLNIINSSLSWVGSSWTLTLTVEGGTLPALTERIEAQIDLDQTGDFTYCGFDRFPAGQDTDVYDPDTDLTTITLASNSRVNWSNETVFTLKIFDSTGYDTIIINKP